jgi:hypothetical protein
VKKNLFILLILAAVLTLAGCPAETEGRVNISDSKGLRGIISGVVYDAFTAQPISGVTVNLGTNSIKTDKNGAYAFKDIPEGIYTVSFYKDDYTFRSRNVKVDVFTKYKTDDPYLEYAAFNSQIAAFQTWVAGKSSEGKIPGYETAATGNNTWEWTYQDGVWITGDGAKVTYTGDGKFEVVDELLKVDADYSYGIPMYVTGLYPLIGSFKGKLMVYTIPYDRRFDVKLSDAVPASKVEIWFESANPLTVGGDIPTHPDTITTPPWDGNEDNQGSITEVTGVRYGPAETKKDGTFKLDKLPAGTELKLRINGFTQDGFYYSNATTVYSYTGTGNGNLNEFSVTPKSNGTVDLGDLYVFSVGSYAVVTDFDLGTPAAPKGPRDALNVTFNKPIDQAGLTATIFFPVDNNAYNINPGTDGVYLNLAVSVEGQVVTLKPSLDASGSLPILPRSINGSLPAGYLRIKGYATDGSEIIAASDDGTATLPKNGLRVYTREKLRFIGFEEAPADIPASRGMISAKAVKLSFTKPLHSYADIKWGNDQADYTVSGNDIFVWTDRLQRDNPKNLVFKVYAKDDVEDSVDNGTGTDTKYELAKLYTRLELASVPFYNARVPFIPYDLDSTQDDNFPTTGTVSVTFTRAIPTGARVFAQLGTTGGYDQGTYTSPSPPDYSMTTTFSGATVTIPAPAAGLQPGTAYYVSVIVIADNGEVLFNNDDLNRYTAKGHQLVKVDQDNITFNTAAP